MGSIKLEAVKKRFGSHEVIHEVDLEVKDRERVVFVGPSGCGKSTLLRLICGIEDVSEGRILIDDNDVTGMGSARREVAMVFQNYALYPHMTVEENIGFSLRVAGKRRAERVAPVREVASMLQLDSLLARYPKELSGGQKQRVAIGRALVRNPKAFLFDEPLSNLDAALRSEMRLEIARLHKQLGTTMIYVTHDQAEAMTLADRIVVLNAGRIEQIDTPRMLYHAPANLFVARFIGSPTINLIDVERLTALGLSDVASRVVLRYGTAARTIGLRPEDLGLEVGNSATSSTCLNVEYFGSETIAFLKGPGDVQLAVKAAGEPNWQPGQSYAVKHQGEGILAFDGKGDAMPQIA